MSDPVTTTRSIPFPTSVEAALKRYWGFSELRSPQAEIVQALLAGRDALVVLPTGFGKSLCFQLPAVLQSGTSLAISPLIALMEDQARQLQQRGIAAEALHGQLERHQKRRILQRLERGQLSLFYVSPEMLFHSSVWQRLQQPSITINAAVVDEAHTVVDWGTSFRPAYMRLGALRRGLQQQFPVAAFTATANPETQATLRDVLELENPLEIRVSPRRSNIRIAIAVAWTVAGRRKQLMDFVRRHQQETGLIYARTRSSGLELAAHLRANGLAAAAYHGGMGASERHRLEQEWQAGERSFLVCTKAFGMGIDCPTVRWVAHYQPPSTVTDYVQEIGRAGRDGRSAQALMLVSEPTGLLDGSDRQLERYLDQQRERNLTQAKQLLRHLPQVGTHDDVVVSAPHQALGLAILRQADCIRWDDPLSFSKVKGTFPTGRSAFHAKRCNNHRCTSIRHSIETRGCRWRAIETALGYPQGSPCGSCDNCERSIKR